MLPALARPLLHTVHLFTFAVLLVTGLLIFVPGLRAVVTGGYSLLIRQSHRWGGVAFAALPVLIVLRYGPRSMFAVPTERTLRTMWQGLHIAVTLVIGAAFTVTGFVLWAKRLVPESLLDTSLLLHDWLTYAAGALVAAHLLEVGLTALVARITSATGPQPSET